MLLTRLVLLLLVSSTLNPPTLAVHARPTGSTLSPRHRDRYYEDDRPLLERDAGAIKGYYVVIIILSLLIIIQTIAWFAFLYRLRRLRRR